MTDNPCLDAAIYYTTKAQLFVFPANPGEKKSRVSRRFAADGKNWGMTNNPDTVQAYWKKWPDSNVCIVTGEINNLFVVEIDTPEGHDVDGEAALRDLIAANGGYWPDTKQARSPTGSLHYYFEWPPGNVTIVNSDGKLAPGIDVRGEGGMVVAPPSIKSSSDSRQYTWLNPNQTIAKAPAWLISLLATTPTEHKPSEPQEQDINLIAEAMRSLPNDPNITWEVTDAKTGVIESRTGWEGWNDIGMALFRGTGGSDEAFKIFEEWCKKNSKYQDSKSEQYTRYSWYTRWKRTPPKRLGIGTIFKLANEYAPGWRAMYNEEHREEISKARVETAIKTERYEVKLSAGNNDNIYDTEQYLMAAKVPLYVFGRTLVRPITMEVRAMGEKLTKIAQLYDVEPEYLKLVANEKITFLKWDAKTKKWLSVDPPMKIIHGMMSLVGHWKFPVITGVISTPTIRADGSVFSQPGYDPATRMLMIEPPAMPPIKDKVTRGDALESLELLDQLLKEFSFIDDTAKSVALSAILTPVVRCAFALAPMHINKAPTPASGKSYLFDVVAAIAIGQRMPATAAGRNEEETEKRLGASLLIGQPLISIDNVNGELGGDSLGMIIERPVMTVRVLGKSENRMVETTSTTMFATGNNITMVGDLTRRCLICTLDPNMERPELREYKQDPIKMVLDDRGKYIAACLTICRAFIQSGAPTVKKLGSFEGWSNVVRSSLIWLNRADPVGSQDIARTDDPRLSDLESILTQWALVIGTGEINAVHLTKVIDMCQENGESGYDKFVLRYPDFNEAVSRVASVYGRPPEAKRFGYWARSVKGRLVGGMKLMSARAPSGGDVTRWWVQHGGDARKATPGLREQAPNVINVKFKEPR